MTGYVYEDSDGTYYALLPDGTETESHEDKAVADSPPASNLREGLTQAPASTSTHTGLLGLNINRPGDSTQPGTVSLSVEIDGVGIAFLDLDEHQFLNVLSGLVSRVDVLWRPEAGA